VLYNYAGRPDKTADIVHLLLEKAFTDNRADASLALGNGKNFHVVVRNLDRDGLNRYVQSATLNGVDLPTSWFRHAQIRDGATLVLTMGSAPSNEGKTTPPPSMSDANFDGCPGAK